VYAFHSHTLIDCAITYMRMNLITLFLHFPFFAGNHGRFKCRRNFVRFRNDSAIFGESKAFCVCLRFSYQFLENLKLSISPHHSNQWYLFVPFSFQWTPRRRSSISFFICQVLAIGCGWLGRTHPKQSGTTWRA
jgi:hypothetical protein